MAELKKKKKKNKALLPLNKFKNYQPVTGMGFMSKHVEHVVASQLNDHVISNGLDNVSQSA